MSATLLDVVGVSKHFGGFTALSEVSLRVPRGERLGIIGPNGSGKTTLINCVTGAVRADSGSIVFLGGDVTRLAPHQRTRRGMARSFQIPRPFSSMSVAENVAVPLEYAVDRRSLPGAQVHAQAIALLERMGLASRAADPASALTQVELRKLELARALAARPALLILDEVMAGLSQVEVNEMLSLVLSLSEEGVTIVMIEHIMHAIMRFSQRVVCLDAGRIIADGEPAQIVNDGAVRKVYLGADT
jgi:branched-chain amino acid transport system ATP-binding protein